MSTDRERLANALNERARQYTDAIDALEQIAEDNDKPVGTHVHRLREAVELSRVLRRALPHLDLNQIHRAFGAPGDFGYETPIGDALARLYQGGGR